MIGAQLKLELARSNSLGSIALVSLWVWSVVACRSGCAARSSWHGLQVCQQQGEETLV